MSFTPEQLLLCHYPFGPCGTVANLPSEGQDGPVPTFLDALATICTRFVNGRTDTIAVALEHVAKRPANASLREDRYAVIVAANGGVDTALSTHISDVFSHLRLFAQQSGYGSNPTVDRAMKFHYDQLLITKSYEFVWDKFCKTVNKNGRLQSAIDALKNMSTKLRKDPSDDTWKLFQSLWNTLCSVEMLSTQHRPTAEILDMHQQLRAAYVGLKSRGEKWTKKDPYFDWLEGAVQKGFKHYLDKVASISNAIDNVKDMIDAAHRVIFATRTPEFIYLSNESIPYDVNLKEPNLIKALCLKHARTKRDFKAYRGQNRTQNRQKPVLDDYARSEWEANIVRPACLSVHGQLEQNGNSGRFTKPRVNVHCECLIAKSITTKDTRLYSCEFFRYIGCQKLACLGCSLFLQAVNKVSGNAFTMRGCHGKIYPPYVFPHMSQPKVAEHLVTGLIGAWRLAWEKKDPPPKRSDSSANSGPSNLGDFETTISQIRN